MGWVEALRSDKAAVVTLAAIAAILSGLHFGGMPDHYIYVLSAYYFPEIAAADFNLSQSFWPASSVIYALNKVLALQQNEVLVLATAVGVGTAGSVIAHLILRRHFALSAWQAVVAVLLLLMVDRKILTRNKVMAEPGQGVAEY